MAKEMPTVQMSDDDEESGLLLATRSKQSQLHVGNDNELELWASDRYENVSPVGVAQISR
jgi:hypothetical protein